jgi:hypothetical protein
MHLSKIAGTVAPDLTMDSWNKVTKMQFGVMGMAYRNAIQISDRQTAEPMTEYSSLRLVKSARGSSLKFLQQNENQPSFLTIHKVSSK